MQILNVVQKQNKSKNIEKKEKKKKKRKPWKKQTFFNILDVTI